jgi:2-(1,2-epoxy-1,2-dihydrophenyl)acetyl-CoA isomerase
MSAVVLLSVERAVATISLNRPQVLNAMDGEMMLQLRPIAESVQNDPAVRAVVVRGEGPAFMAGGDVSVFHSHLQELPELIVQWGRQMHFAFLALRRMGKPVLASVHGAVAGAGFSLMCAADLAIAAADTKFTLAYANIGASPDGGSTHFLPRLLGYRKAMELALLPDLLRRRDGAVARLVNWWLATVSRGNREDRAAPGQRPTKAYAKSQAADEPVHRRVHRNADGRGTVRVLTLRCTADQRKA